MEQDGHWVKSVLPSWLGNNKLKGQCRYRSTEPQLG